MDGILPQLESFPKLEHNQPIVKQARSYYGRHIRTNGSYDVKACSDLEKIMHLGGSRPQLLRSRKNARHTRISQKIYYVYILYESQRTHNAIDAILSYHCSCIVGNRTLACHVMTVVWLSGIGETPEHTVISGIIELDNVLVRIME